MDPSSEYVVRVKAWPAYLLAALIPVLVVLYGAMVGLIVGAGSSSGSGGFMIFLGPVVVVGATMQLAALATSARQSFQLIRHPPQLSPQGIRLWLFPATEYVMVPWPRVAAIRTATKGLSLALFVYVHDPEALAGGDASRTRKLRRTMRRFRGAPFLYPLESSPGRLREIDGAIRWFSGGRLVLQR